MNSIHKGESYNLVFELTEQYHIIGDYYFHKLPELPDYFFQEEDDNEIVKFKGTLSLRQRIIMDLRLSLLDDSISEEMREYTELIITGLDGFIDEIVAAEKPEILDQVYNSYAVDSYDVDEPGYHLSLFYARRSARDVYFVTDFNKDNPLTNEWRELSAARNSQTKVFDNAESEERFELLNSILFNNPVAEAEREQHIIEFSKQCMHSSLITDALETCLYVKFKYKDYLHLQGKTRVAPTLKVEPKTRRNRAAKRGFTAPGEILEGTTKISMHAMRQIFNPKNLPKTSPSEIALDWSEKTGLPVKSEIDRYGLDLTTTQYKVMEGILRAFSETQYKGNLPAATITETLQEQKIRFQGKSNIPVIFKNLVEVPRIQISQRDLLRLSGIDENNKGEMIDGLEALTYLSTTQFCFYYTRLTFDGSGKPEKDAKSGDYKKEEVQGIDELFTIKRVSDNATKEFKYYEIMPSPIFLDQVDRHFLLVPRGWMEEVKGKVGLKRASSYTFRFLLYLRFQFEEKRRKIRYQKSACRYEIKSSWQQIAKDLKMPESVYNRQRKRALGILDDAYSTALQLGYLISHDREGDMDTLVLNVDKYPAPKVD